MAITQTILKNTFHEAIIKVAGLPGTQTITLASLKKDNETQCRGNISAILCSGDYNGLITIVRDGDTLYNLQSSALQLMDLRGNPFIPDSINNTKDIDVIISGAQSELLIQIKKTGHKIIL
jgi:hypothetical protein